MPRSFLQPGSNDLVLFEQFGGDPGKISFVIKQTGSVCAHVSEAHPAQIDSWFSPQQNVQRSGPALRLECPKAGEVISSIKFASFGTPSGTCGSYNHGECSSSQALAVVQEVTTICHTFAISQCFQQIILPYLSVFDKLSSMQKLLMVLLESLQACVGVSSCSVPVSSKNLGDPCSGVTKSLAVEAACS